MKKTIMATLVIICKPELQAREGSFYARFYNDNSGLCGHTYINAYYPEKEPVYNI